MKIKLIVAALSGAFSLGLTQAASQPIMSAVEYATAKERIEVAYKAAKERCKPLAGNTRDICYVEAKGEHAVARKELEARYRPTDKNRHDVRVAKAESQYQVAREKCDDRAGNDRDVCMKEARAAEAKAKADARLDKEVKEVVATAGEKTAKVESDAAAQIRAARQNAAQARLDADYKVAREKCDAMAGEVKDNCVAAVKRTYGK